jgi:hypothetical protein
MLLKSSFPLKPKAFLFNLGCSRVLSWVGIYFGLRNIVSDAITDILRLTIINVNKRGVNMKENECELVRNVIKNANKAMEKTFYITEWMIILQGNDCY